MQERLKDMGYYKKESNGDFGSGTDTTVRAFQADVFGSMEADGKVGPKTWAKLWESALTVPVSQTPGVPGKTIYSLQKSTEGIIMVCAYLCWITSTIEWSRNL